MMPLVFVQLMDKYESALVDLDRDQPRYMEDMERAFERCQLFEKNRLVFFKEIFENTHSHLDLSKVEEWVFSKFVLFA